MEAGKEISQVPAQMVLVNDSSQAVAVQEVGEEGAIPFDIPIVTCSVPGVEQASELLGAAGYLLKPISQEVLLSTLDGLGHKIETVMVVDDEPDVQQLFGRMLAMSGREYRVLRAHDGKAALDLLRQQAVDVVLLDLVMPEMDGYQLLSILREKPDLKDIPVILISARDPLSQPVYSRVLTITRQHGLSINDLFACVEAINRILSRSKQSNAKDFQANPPPAGPTPEGTTPG
jgi:CheY-like chemotaxis protein